MGIKEKVQKGIAKARVKGVGGVFSDSVDTVIETTVKVARGVKKEVEERGGLGQVVSDSYHSAERVVKSGIDSLFTDGTYDAQKGKDIYKGVMQRAGESGRNVRDYLSTSATGALERLKTGAVKQWNEIESLRVSDEERQTIYAGIGTIVENGRVRNSTMIRPEFDAVIAFREQVKEHLPIGKPYVAQIRDDVEHTAVTSATGLLSMYTTHSDFVDEPATARKIGLVKEHLLTLDNKL